jgi:hypothetical protein
LSTSRNTILAHQVGGAQDEKDSAGDNNRLLGGPDQDPQRQRPVEGAEDDHVGRGNARALRRGEQPAEDAAENDDRRKQRTDHPNTRGTELRAVEAGSGEAGPPADPDEDIDRETHRHQHRGQDRSREEGTGGD